MNKISSIRNLKKHPKKNDVEAWLKDEVPVKDIVIFLKEDGYKIGEDAIRRFKKDFFTFVGLYVRKLKGF